MNRSLDLSALRAWTRLSKDVIAPRSALFASGDGNLNALVPDPDRGPSATSTRTFTPDDLREAAAQGYLATSDDPLWLIRDGDVVEVTSPPDDPSPARTRDRALPQRHHMVANLPAGTARDEASAYFSADPLPGFPPGSVVTAICLQPSAAGGSPVPLAKRAFPDGPWTQGVPPAPPAGRRAQTSLGEMMDLLDAAGRTAYGYLDGYMAP